MTVLGGFRTFVGPIVGAIAFNYLKTYAVGFTVYWQLLLGIVLVVLVLVAAHRDHGQRRSSSGRGSRKRLAQ